MSNEELRELNIKHRLQNIEAVKGMIFEQIETIDLEVKLLKSMKKNLNEAVEELVKLLEEK